MSSTDLVRIRIPSVETLGSVVRQLGDFIKTVKATVVLKPAYPQQVLLRCTCADAAIPAPNAQDVLGTGLRALG